MFLELPMYSLRLNFRVLCCDWLIASHVSLVVGQSYNPYSFHLIRGSHLKTNLNFKLLLCLNL